MPAYTWKDRVLNLSEVRILNVSDAVHIWHKVTVQITEQLSRQRRIRAPSNIWNGAFFKKKQGVGEVSETRALRQNILSKTQKKRPLENILEFFLLDSLKTTFWMENLPQRWTQSVPFFPKPGHFFDFQKMQWGSLLSPQVERLWVWLNLHQYSWICLNIFENAWIYCFVRAKALNMHDHDHFTCSIGFCRCLKF